MPPNTSLYLAHPWRDRPHALPGCLAWYSWTRTQVGPDVDIVMGWVLEALVLDQNDMARARALERSAHVIAGCNSLWLVGGQISSGMRRELEYASEFGVRVWDRTGMGLYPPGWSADSAIAAARVHLEAAM